MDSNIYISVVSPVYKAENIIQELVRQLDFEISKITPNFEIILVNDCSPDDSWNQIKIECEKNSKVKGINLSRNFGQHYAITAGLNYACGEWVVVMDCDLQDRPEEIYFLHKLALEGNQSVFAQRVVRNDNLIKKLSSKLFYIIFSYLTETKQDGSVANFGIYHNSVIKAVLSLGDKIRYFPTMVQWVGFKKAYLPVKHDSRFEGKTSYNFNQLLKLAISTILAFSDRPLRLTLKVGFIISFSSFLVGLFYYFGYITKKITISGFTSIIISIWFLSGIIIFIIGFLGLYIGKIFEQVKDRPSFIVQNKINL